MAKKKLTIKGITFPDFGKDKSKKNFRLVFYVAYTDAAGNDSIATVAKPGEGQWQWRNKDKPAFLEPKIVGNSAELNVSALNGGNGIPAGSKKITEIDGDITAITVDFMDVHDQSALDIFVNVALPQLIEALKATGFDPIDFIPGSGMFKGRIPDGFKTDDLIKRAQDFFKGQLKDKKLHTLSDEYNGEATLNLKQESVEWDDGKFGTYAVSVGVA